MPTHLKYFNVQYRNRVTGKIHTAEMSEITLDALKLAGMLAGDSVEILDETFVRTERLGSRRREGRTSSRRGFAW